MKIKPSIAPRLWFHALDADSLPVTDLTPGDITSAAYVTITAGVRSAPASITLGSKVADTAAKVTGQLVTIDAADGWYAIDAPAGAALATADYAELAIVLTDGTRLVYPTRHPIDAAVASVPGLVRTDLTTELARIDAAISSRNATTPPTTAAIATAVWGAGTRTLSAISDSAGITTLLTRITALLKTKTQDDTDQTAVITAIGDVPTNTELAARTLPTAGYFNPLTNTVARVTLVDTTTANTDMRGTDGANTVAPDNDSIAAIELKTANLPANPAAVGDAMTLTAAYDVQRNDDTATVYASNNTDTLDAIVSAPGPWTATGKITGDNAVEAGRYDFAGLADDTEYTVRVRAGTDPAASDLVVATIPIPAKSEIRNALKGRWTNQGTGTNYDDIEIEDTQ